MSVIERVIYHQRTLHNLTDCDAPLQIFNNGCTLQKGYVLLTVNNGCMLMVYDYVIR